MRVKVDAGLAGRGDIRHRLRFAQNGRIVTDYMGGGVWTRQMASRALNLLEQVYGLKRRNIRFEHR